MQTHMGHILMDDIALLWLKHADPTVVLSMGLQRGIHPCLRHVSAKQFIEDEVWFFGAMKQAITGRGKNIIQQFEKSQDGISAWRSFHTGYCYDGNVEVYLSQQQQVLLRKFHPKCQGGALQFVEDHESACINIEYVIRTNPRTGRALDGATLCTDKGKRNTFAHSFTCPGLTSELIESVEVATSTWEEMVNELCHRLACRSIHDKNFENLNAHLISHDLDSSMSQVNNTQLMTLPPMMINAVQQDMTRFINALSQD